METERPQLKRKIREISTDDIPTKIKGKLYHELREVHQACKKAKTFETQKLVKRLKALRKNTSSSSEITDHEAQLVVLKDLSIHPIVNTALKTKILKDHKLKDNEFITAALEKELNSNILVPAAPGTPLAKVQSRLLSSKHLSTQILASLNGLKSTLDPELKARNKKSRTSSAEPQAPSKRASSSPKPPPLVEGDGDDEDEDEVDEGGSDRQLDGISDSEGEGAADDDGWESGSIDGEGVGQRGSSTSSQNEDSDEDEDDTKINAKVKPRKEPSKITSKPIKAKPSTSTFLPSLAVGYISGSDDSDIEREVEVAEPRKNRRGQRARRAIWEKKFGKNANHKKAEAAAMPEVRYPKGKSFGNSRQCKGRVQILLSGSNLTQHGPTRAFGQRPASAPAPLPASSKPNADKPLHPSWEAKKKAKEKQLDMMALSQGKKIRF